MKNKFKFLVLLLILPVMFVFAGCGQLDAEASVDTGNEAKYEQATTQELNTSAKDDANNKNAVVANAIRVTFKYSVLS